MKFFSFTVVAILTLASSLHAEITSGPAPGEQAGTFMVYDVTGPAAGKTLCYRCRLANRPTVAVFARELNDDLAALVKSLDEAVERHERERLGAFVVLLADTNHKLDVEKELREFAARHKLTTPLTIFENVEGPKEYRLAADARVTVLWWKNGEMVGRDARGASARGEITAAVEAMTR